MPDLIPNWMKGSFPAGSVDTGEVNWGTGTGQVDADDMPIDDVLNLIAATTVEGALAELAARVTTIVTVGPTGSGCDYTDIATALSNILDNATGKRYTIAVAPGSYNVGGITLKDYVSIQGSGVGATQIAGLLAIGTVANQCDIRGCSVTAASLAVMLKSPAVTSDLILNYRVAFGFDGNGAVIPVNVFADWFAPVACHITGAYTMVESTVDATYTITFGVWSDTWTNYKAGTVPTSAVKITGTAYPTVTNLMGADDLTLTGWTWAVPSGNVIRVNVDACTDVVKARLVLAVRRAVA